MAYRLIWAPSSRLDLRELASYIAEYRPRASASFVKNVFRTVEHLSDFLKSGRVVPEFNEPNIREIIRKPCRIVYRVKPKDHVVEIVRVWHAARGIPHL
jgi:plasmid stabilization system protein ParE